MPVKPLMPSSTLRPITTRQRCGTTNAGVEDRSVCCSSLGRAAEGTGHRAEGTGQRAEEVGKDCRLTAQQEFETGYYFK